MFTYSEGKYLSGKKRHLLFTFTHHFRRTLQRLQILKDFPKCDFLDSFMHLYLFNLYNISCSQIISMSKLSSPQEGLGSKIVLS